MIAVLLGMLLAAGAPASSYRIAGAVVHAVTQQPVARARVTLVPVEHNGQPLAVVTGTDGRFAFVGIPAGKYELRGQRRGFLALSLAEAIVAGPDQDTGNIVLALAPPAAVTGKVTDDAGEPVEHAQVELLSARIIHGRRRVASFASRQTDDLGEYRFADVPPGTYYVAASGHPWYTKLNETHGDAAPRGMTHAGYAIKYYPNVSEAAAAEPVVLKAGQEAAASFSLVAVPAASLSVHFENAEEMAKHFTLTTAGLAGNPIVVREASEPGDVYNFWGVPPGRYTLRAEAQNGAGRTLYARSEIDVGTNDVEAGVAFQEAPKLSGSLEVEGGALPPGVMVRLTSEETGRTTQAPIAPGGKFSFAAIAPERYRVSLLRAEDDYLKGWAVDGATRDGDTLEIAEGAAARLRLLVARGAGRVHGTVERDGHPMPGALVVLAPAAGARGGEPHAVESASDGSYDFRGVPPGEYALFAATDGGDLEYANPAAIRPYLGAAEKVRIEAGGSANQRLTLEPPPKN